jgi:streptomycin 6-kinase
MTNLVDLYLPNGIVIPADQVKGTLWGGVTSGIAWLQHLPTLVETLCQRFSIKNLRPAPEIRMNLVLFGDSAIHGPVVLKVAQPHPEASNEIACMRIMSSTGRYSRLIDADPSSAWSLQERILPGEMLQTFAQSGEISDADATEITARLMQETTAPVPGSVTHSFPNLDRWLKSLWEHALNPLGIIPSEQLELAVQHAQELVEKPDAPMLLHGDFHHGNILRADHEWMMIDPKGIVAEKAFEVGPFFYNPIGVDKRPDLPALFAKRLDIFENVLEIDRVRLWRCALVGCVLSDCWSLEDGPVDHTHFDTVTAALMSLPERNA